MVHVLATIQLYPGKRGDFLAEFRRLVPQVRAEHGCMEYGLAVDLTTDIAAQQPLGEDAAMVVEKWTSIEALKAHLAAPHMATYRERVKLLVESVKLAILQPA
jgi:quinol monooxygenase YgiN